MHQPLVSFFVKLFRFHRTDSTTYPDSLELAFRSSNPKSYANPQGKKTLHSNHLHRFACANLVIPEKLTLKII